MNTLKGGSFVEKERFHFLIGMGTNVFIFIPVIYKINKRISHLEDKIRNLEGLKIVK